MLWCVSRYFFFSPLISSIQLIFFLLNITILKSNIVFSNINYIILLKKSLLYYFTNIFLKYAKNKKQPMIRMNGFRICKYESEDRLDSWFVNNFQSSIFIRGVKLSMKLTTFSLFSYKEGVPATNNENYIKSVV